MNFKKVLINTATLGPVGYLPASGTVATFITMGVLLIFWWFGYTSALVMKLVLPVVGLSGIIIHYVLRYFESGDPKEIVLDEVAGYMLAASLFPLRPAWLLSAALLFRFFDILKPLGIRFFERIGGVAGILLDDLLAAVYTQVTIILFLIITEKCIRLLSSC